MGWHVGFKKNITNTEEEILALVTFTILFNNFNKEEVNALNIYKTSKKCDKTTTIYIPLSWMIFNFSFMYLQVEMTNSPRFFSEQREFRLSAIGWTSSSVYMSILQALDLHIDYKWRKWLWYKNRLQHPHYKTTEMTFACSIGDCSNNKETIITGICV